MKLICPQCRTSYDVTPAALGADGRQVRCARCQSVWYAEAPKLAANVIPLAAHDLRTAPLAGVVRNANQVPPGTTAQVPQAPAVDIAPVGVGPAETGPAAAEISPATASAGLPTALADVPPMTTVPADGATAVAPAPSEDAGAPEQADAHVSAADVVPAAPAAPDTVVVTPPPVDVESVAARRLAGRPPVKRPQRTAWRFRKLVAAAVVLAIVDAALIIGRADVVRALPQTASLFETIGLPVNLRALTFKDVKTSQETHDGVPILVIEGTIVATGHAVADVPRLRFSISAGNGHEIYAWTALPTRTKLAPGETLPFRTRLASPPEQGRSAKIRFFNRLDLASGLR